MNPESFKSSTGGSVRRVGSGDSGYWAFIPHPLPPELKIDFKFMQQLSEADRALGELAGIGRAMANPRLFVRPFISREAVLSSRIEGTQADLHDLFAYTAEGRPKADGAKHADVLEVYNYVRAMDYGVKRLESFPVSLRLIRELHEHLMKGVRGGQATPGEFRRSQNWIGPPGCTLNDAVFVPPPVDEMNATLDAFEKYLHETNSYPPLVRLALIHHQFESIHPFLDGNGRIGRLLMSLLLVHWGLLPYPLLYLSAFFERNRISYYDLLLGVNQNGAWSAWISFFLQGVAEQSKDAIERAKHLQDLQSQWREMFQKSNQSALLLGVIDLLFMQPLVTAVRVRDKFKVTHPTAMSALRRLVKEGILTEPEKKGRNRWFIAQQILRIAE
ncbi:MAG TPA: cell filamentation protein Fic [Bacteroidetes bacterium]|nr:cell filamentation protein Fic [Bacteroidota bacterium]